MKQIDKLNEEVCRAAMMDRRITPQIIIAATMELARLAKEIK